MYTAGNPISYAPIGRTTRWTRCRHVLKTTAYTAQLPLLRINPPSQSTNRLFVRRRDARATAMGDMSTPTDSIELGLQRLEEVKKSYVAGDAQSTKAILDAAQAILAAGGRHKESQVLPSTDGEKPSDFLQRVMWAEVSLLLLAYVKAPKVCVAFKRHACMPAQLQVGRLLARLAAHALEAVGYGNEDLPCDSALCRHSLPRGFARTDTIDSPSCHHFWSSPSRLSSFRSSAMLAPPVSPLMHSQ